MPDQLSSEQIEEISQALIQSNKIAAIKNYRDAAEQNPQHGWFILIGVTKLIFFYHLRVIRKPLPLVIQKFAHLNKVSGCAGMILLALMTSLGLPGISLTVNSAVADTPTKTEKQEIKPLGYDTIDKYKKMQLSDWQLIVHQDLIDQEPKLWGQVRQELKHQFYQIQRRVPANAVKKMKLVPIWVELSERHHPGLVYHPNPSWLKNHAMNPDKARCVEISNAHNFVNWSIAQPYCILHEMAHAWHHQQLPEGFGNKEISLTLQRAKQKILYGPVLHINEKSRQAYAGTNPMEYFAESSEAFFGTNDFYPFVRSELKEYDPEMYDLVGRVWGVKK